jgi:hypothetical protein
MIQRLALAACLPLTLLAGCAIHQNVHPLDAVADSQVCIIDNPEVRPGVMATYRRVLSDKGYAVRQLPRTAAITMYMHYAEFRVFVDGKEKGTAIYDATRGGGNPNKFIDADKKIAELVNQLFPGGAGNHAAVPAPGTTSVQ